MIIGRKFIYSWRADSDGARELSRALGIPRIRHEHSKYRPKKDDVIINWGSSTVPISFGEYSPIINDPLRVQAVSNKLRFFQMCQEKTEGPRTPRWTGHRDVAHDWLLNGKTVVARTVLTGHSGRGIIIIQPGEPLVDAPLYVQYVKKDMEFRVHLMKNKTGDIDVIDVQRKIRDPDREPIDWKVRSHANGFIFVRGGITPSEDVITQSKKAFACSRLDFGAVDSVTDKTGTAFVLECNTAPGLEGQTIKSYADGFKRLLL